jgi:hypothetical protein
MTTTLDFDRVAQFLSDNPQFFDAYAHVLSEVRLASPLTGRTLSLPERQMEVMREKHKALELRMAELLRHGQENNALIRKFNAWVNMLLLTRVDKDLPLTLTTGLKTLFHVPQVTLRLWRVAPEYQQAWFAQNVTETSITFAQNLKIPYCGKNKDFEVVHWLGSPNTVLSTAIIPLHIDATLESFGLLILGSEDPDRFLEHMGTDFLSELGTTASAALMCLLD